MEDAFLINGGNELLGRVELHGAKNAVLPMLAASLLTDEEVTIEDCPHISDVFNMLELVREVGGETFVLDRNISVRGRAVKNCVSKRLQKVMRSSMFMLGVLLATVGEV
ncbi:MAG: UDP-N-acetylglucosamine 1-carboxyvinyltransferase, partial [Clostridia bacterium]|nr:UDP-N-acetylglucosamine 1-carboxyvinyltransferase [Clostridia bacterium]